MALDSDIRDQAYQFFIAEALDLLQVIETELLTLQQDRSTSKIHSMMRAAHSIKGGAASVDLFAIKDIAHRLEDCFKALHHETLVIDAALETLFLYGFDCLKTPLMDEIETGFHDPVQAQTQAEAALAALEAALEPYLGGEAHLPSSIELGVDIALSIFEVDVAEGLDRLAAVLSSAADPEIASELRAQAEVFIGISELLNLSGFGAIAQTAFAAVSTYPEHAVAIAHAALANFQAGHAAVLAGDRRTGGEPSIELLQWLDAPTVHLTEPATSDMEGLWGDDPVLPEPVLSDTTVLWSNPEVSLPEDTASNMDLLWGDEDSIVSSTEEIWDTSESAIATTELWEDTPDEIPTTAEIWDSPPESAIAGEIWEDTPDIAPSTDEIWAAPETAPMAQIWDDTPELEQVAEDHSENLAADTIQIPETHDQPVQDWMHAIANNFDALPSFDPSSLIVGTSVSAPAESITPEPSASPNTAEQSGSESDNANQLTVRVQLDRLEQMNNQVGELVINRNSLSLQNQQLQKTVQELLRRFSRFQSMAKQLRSLSDQMLIAGDHNANLDSQRPQTPALEEMLPLTKLQAEFDSLEMDSYDELHLLLQSTLEEVAQLEEVTGDVGLLSKQSSQALNTQRQMLSRLQEDLMWARMLPIGQVLNRFPRVLRDLSYQHHKLVDLKLNGTSVLVDKAVLEQLYSPLMHIVRNAFDHGIELPDVRKQRGKPEQGHITIRAYHRGNQTIIEVQDDGQGVNYDRIRDRAVSLGWISEEQAATLTKPQLIEYMFQPGFSTAAQVTDLSGRGVGLDVVRSQIQSLKGKVTVTSEPQQGTTFTLRIPLTLTINKLLICQIGPVALALPSDSIEEILVPKPAQIKVSSHYRFLQWRHDLVPLVSLADTLDYACPLPSAIASQALAASPTPDDWLPPLLLLRQGKEILAVEVDRVVTEQELVIKPYGSVIAAPSYLYGCTTLGDGSLVPVLDGAGLFEKITQQSLDPILDGVQTFVPETESVQASAQASRNKLSGVDSSAQSTVLVVDDSIALRQTLALTLQKAGHRVLQARDGREALDQLQQNSSIQMVVCDIEMPNMNGFEFLSHRRQNAEMLKVPVAMLTSRSNDKHRRLALHLGANDYFVKPYIEQEFLNAIAKLIHQPQPVGAT
jgi:two-component system, chemotaxis family, sensor histidine kinase and response regulator PixL